MDVEEPTTDLRKRIMEVAQHEFAQRGYAKVTVDDIIGAARTSRASFYRYFRSKDDLFEQLSRDCFSEIRELTKAFSTSDLGLGDGAGAEVLVRNYTNMQKRQLGVVRAWLELADRPQSAVRREASRVFRSLLGGFEELIQRSAAPSRVPPDVQAALLLTLLSRATAQALHRDSRVDPDVLPSTLGIMIDRAYFGAMAGGYRTGSGTAAIRDSDGTCG